MDIALVVSDVDGTLVTTDKRLTPATVAAVRRLQAAGIAFTLASSRPPIGLKALVEALDLSLPLGAFNGATIVRPDLSPVAQTLLQEDTAQAVAGRLEAAGVDLWIFAQGAWILRDPDGAYTDLEARTVGADPRVVPDLAPFLTSASKLVGVSRDVGLLHDLERDLSDAFAGRAAIHRSQPYYLDVTPPHVDKGRFVSWIAESLGIGPDRIATLGDAGNDVALFRRGRLSIAMGNAAPEVQRAASAITASNDADGFAEAVDRLILPRR
ncbi:Cof-type HAD-IIB family hydrolase [Methylobacterium organophilum]|uniref:Phosphatase n=1 Tax=Methylobacterium organophilum TaxID=410 RepID=A0ABQ4T700_METOR|nr:Cof-type HAD-IIB family hydrolase [Methylobacterium organophilum]GJE26046.1 Putative phosphatase [Methylobacterium organophilum]